MAKVSVEETKWFQSKTVWFNVLMAVVLIADGLGSLNVVPAQWLAVITLVGNVLLRVFITGSPIAKSVK